MRISFVLANGGLSGGVRVVAMLAEHLRRRGHQVLVVFPGRQGGSLRDRARRLVFGRPPADPGLVTYFTTPGMDVPCRQLDYDRPVGAGDLPPADAVVATFWVTAEWVAALPPECGAKVYFVQQYEANFGFPADRVDATWRLPLRKVACSGWLADLARDRFGDPDVAVVPNGVDPALFHAPPRGKQPVPTVGFLYAPGGTEVKGTPTALAVLAEVRRRLPALRVRAFGVWGPDPAYPLPPYADYTRQPPQAELRHIYAGCDAWLCTSTSEGFHLPPHEAMACRCPVVSTRVGGPTDLVEHGVNGFLADVGDVAALADRLTDVLSRDEAGWRAMSDAAHATAVRFTWEAAAERFEQALRAADPAGAAR